MSRTSRHISAQSSVAPVEIVPFAAAYREGLVRLYAGLSPRSNLFRFLVPTPRLSERQLALLWGADGVGHVALLALHGSTVVGDARYVRYPGDPRAADIAVTVADEWQGRGLGRRLLRALAAAARAAGVERFTLDVHAENRVALRFFASFGARFAIQSGVAEGSLVLAGVRPSQGGGSAPARRSVAITVEVPRVA
jgi:RimJ/RimL family protein N-acetyltransferase